MYAGDELHDDDVTSGPEPDPRNVGCSWCEDYVDGFDPDPCPEHQAK